MILRAVAWIALRPTQKRAYIRITMLLRVTGQQYSGEEVSAILDRAGFIDIQLKPTY